MKDPFTVISLCGILYFPLIVTDSEKTLNHQYYRNIPWSGRLAHFNYSDINGQLKWTRRRKISINLLINKSCLSRTSNKMTQMIIIMFYTRVLETFSIEPIKKKRPVFKYFLNESQNWWVRNGMCVGWWYEFCTVFKSCTSDISICFWLLH